MKLYVFLFFAYICNAYVITNNSTISNDNSLNKRGGMEHDRPYHDSEFKHYIGYTHDDCSNIKICLPNTRRNYCYTTQDFCPDGTCQVCTHKGTTYTTCYDSKTNEKTWVFPNVDSYKNPFHDRNKDDCRSKWNVILNPGDDKNCYVSPKSKIVLVKNNKKRNGVTTNIEKGRCLAGIGWCPCSLR
ncbi:hypothetical protein PIROE2DRAFT_6143 [Piromyces sp. E2]|nr:hypothetical protein PIROE2DRAFT_6143 [Piromyces sp. E2]|eukprot:OUM66612.1 hypothetical protein PIROE2DRAFT_6143 [Piromyces sp. E2]